MYPAADIDIHISRRICDVKFPVGGVANARTAGSCRPLAPVGPHVTPVKVVDSGTRVWSMSYEDLGSGMVLRATSRSTCVSRIEVTIGGGVVPVNPSGGRKANAPDATVVAHHVEFFEQMSAVAIPKGGAGGN